jgi:hypothetical protein
VDSFIDVSDFLLWGEDIADPARAELALAAACDAVRDRMSQTLNAVTGDVITLVGTDSRALLLPELPVTAVTSVTVNGVAVTDWTLDAYGAGILWRDARSSW